MKSSESYVKAFAASYHVPAKALFGCTTYCHTSKSKRAAYRMLYSLKFSVRRLCSPNMGEHRPDHFFLRAKNVLVSFFVSTLV